jgi:hypothetical protein
MKIKTTKKAVKESFSKVYAAGYCDMQFLLRYEEAFAYSKGVSGWQCDYYQIEDLIISTGYAPVGIRIEGDLARKYENLARDYYRIDNMHDDNKEYFRNLIKELIKELEG